MRSFTTALALAGALLAGAAMPAAQAQSAVCTGVPAWNSATIYSPGDRLVFSNRLYEAQSPIWNTRPDHCPSCGWYVDLVPPAPGTPEGERIVTDNAVVGRILLAASIIPSSDPCDVGGQGFINAIDAFTGAALSNPFFDLNGDGSFDAGDTISDGQGDGSNRVSVGSINLGVRMPSQPALIQNLLVVGGSSGGTGSVGINDPAERGRISWREIVRE